MSEAPERIYIDRGPRGGWMHRYERMPDTVAEYVRADRMEELEARCLRLTDERDRAIEWRDHDKARAEAAEAKLAKAVEALQAVIDACDQGRMIPRAGAGGMTIEANIRGSVYTGVPAWPIEEARDSLAEINGGV